MAGCWTWLIQNWRLRHLQTFFVVFMLHCCVCKTLRRTDQIMADIVAMLSNEAASLTAPRDPAFVFRQPEVPYVHEREVCSNNEVTHSAMEPR